MIRDYAKNFRESTEQITEPVTDTTPLAIAWLLSQDRARFNAENEENNVMNYSEYIDAVDAGYTKKTWLTELDDRVRQTHRPLEMVTIPMDDLFKVGAAYMRFPRDLVLSANFPEEVINCRCAVSYGR